VGVAMRQYVINDIFASPQGEGVRAGTPNLFVRFAGCNLACDVAEGPRSPGGFPCDTEFVSGMPMTAEALAVRCREVAPQLDWIILTGGEPALQLDLALVATLKAAGYQLAIETNGTVNIDALGLDWVCVSPKVAEHALQQRTADEVKYVRNCGQGIPKTQVQAKHYVISPAFTGDSLDRTTLAWCLKLVMDNPPWRLSLQLHKVLHVR
jgi:7-carboxy-7-deazaguanine synthase